MVLLCRRCHYSLTDCNEEVIGGGAVPTVNLPAKVVDVKVVDVEVTVPRMSSEMESFLKENFEPVNAPTLVISLICKNLLGRWLAGSGLLASYIINKKSKNSFETCRTNIQDLRHRRPGTEVEWMPRNSNMSSSITGGCTFTLTFNERNCQGQNHLKGQSLQFICKSTRFQHQSSTVQIQSLANFINSVKCNEKTEKNKKRRQSPN